MTPLLTIHFDELARVGATFADYLRSRRNEIQSALASYASFPAVEDEIVRATYLLENLEENREYFQDPQKVDEVAAFLPRNQLLYATVYMGVIPALLSNHCHVRPPESAHHAYRKLMQAVDFSKFFSNLHLYLGSRIDFVTTRATAADVVIFTGTFANGELVRKQLRKNALFLFSGSGHNPVVVRRDADLKHAAEAIARLCYHNQGQDCSAPNAILVDREVSDKLYQALLDRTLTVEEAMKSGRHPENVVAANTDGAHLVDVTEAFLKLQPYLVHGGYLDTKSQIIAPTIFRKPLNTGPHLAEFFAPVIMLQEYAQEIELRSYFTHPRYRPNAMYLTVFGRTPHIEKLGKLDVHPAGSILHNTDLHAEEKGTRPYGGYGSEASFIHFAGNKRPSPILPQREIHHHLITTGRGKAGAAGNGPKRRVPTARDARLEKLKKLSSLGVRPYPARFVPTNICRELIEQYTNLPSGQSTDHRVIVAGRVVAHRNSGMFLDVRDTSGQIQVFCHESQLNRNDLKLLKLIDPGDLLGVTGSVQRTQRGELTVAAQRLTILAKDLQPSLKSQSVPMADNPGEQKRTLAHIAAERRRKLLARFETVAAIRTLMHSQGFHDAEPWAPGTKSNMLPESHVQLGITSAPRFSALIADGIHDRLYQISTQVGNVESDSGQPIAVEATHAFADWRDMMALTENLAGFVIHRLREAELLPQGLTALSPPFPCKPMLAMIEQATGIDFSVIKSNYEARQLAHSLGCATMENETWGQCVASVFVAKVAAGLITPIHVTHLPRDISISAVIDQNDERLVEGFATYIKGQLISSGWTLLNNPFEYWQQTTDGAGSAESINLHKTNKDEEFIESLERGMPPAAVMKMAVDRLVSWFEEPIAGNNDSPGVKDSRA